MKIKPLCLVLILALIASTSAVKAQIANSYLNDVGIESNPNVLYVEKFFDGMANILSRYNDKQNTAGMSLDTDIPPGSPGPCSLKMTSVQGKNVGGHLYKLFSPGFDSTIYIRYYVKYPSSSLGFFHHEGVWFGGYNPATIYPNPQAGSCGLGNSRLSITYETVWQGINPPGMDTYLYWGDMESWNDGTGCYGNAMISRGRTDYNNTPSPLSPVNLLDQWMCIEIMIKLNNPVTAYNGELAVWQNGVQVGHWGPGFPKGHWVKDKWYNNPNDPPFKGFRWRTNALLNINWIWFEFYHDDPQAPSSYLKFAHFVMARKYIGPINIKSVVTNNPDSALVVKVDPSQGLTKDFLIYPNPAYTQLIIEAPQTTKNGILSICNFNGQEIVRKLIDNSKSYIDISNLKKGVYVVKLETDKAIKVRKIIKE
jgi:hypothetical protein